MNSFLGQAQDEIKIFACPACGEMIRVSGAHCPQCGAAIDLQWAQQAAGRQDALNRSFNEANFARNVAQVTAFFYLVSFVPVLGGFGSLGFMLGMFATPILALIWYFRSFVPLQTAGGLHPDLQQAKRRVLIALAIWAGLFVLWIVVGILFALLGLGFSR
jgi:uncharacterized BrkB/YihY/UPF0761 family membrane protein